MRFVKENFDVDLGSTDCLSSDPSIFQKDGVALKDDVAMSALRRILRLDL
ncbi:hypothetical protein Goshw_011473 [Gossypium schwendimanii]|uniref:Uncharacterized protein n=1 Tax=Gossypium schwendimanii TaxID=34291 RepID=A0A7J9KRI8_GOSSC|nr:hypothetical protein [Gossypium schwendimanii]